MADFVDVPYSDEFKQHRLLDVYLPDKNKANGTCIHLIHGGGFKGGNKASWRGVPHHFTSQGFVCITPTYRKLPDFAFPAWIEDLRLAMQWVGNHAGEYGFSKKKIFTMGSSAGGYLALMLGTIHKNDPYGRTDELKGEHPLPCGVVAYCPVTRMWGWHTEFPEPDDPGLCAQTDISKRIQGGEPPMFFIHGNADETIPLASSKKACEKIQEKGGDARLKELDGVGHGFGYGVESDAQKQGLKHADAFISEILGKI